MHVKNANDLPVVTSEHGETVREYAGLSAGGASQHSIAHITIDPGKASRKHYHPEAEESYHILSGEAQIVIDGATEILQPGDVVVIPPRAVHQIFNVSERSELVFLAICVPPWTPDNSVFMDADA